MKTLFEYKDLTPDQQVKLIHKELGEELKSSNLMHTSLRWAVDDCYLFEFPHEKMKERMGEDYDDIVFKNTRKGILFEVPNVVELGGELRASVEISISLERAIEVSKKDLDRWVGIANLHSPLLENVFSCRVEYKGNTDDFANYRGNFQTQIYSKVSIFEEYDELFGRDFGLDPSLSLSVAMMKELNREFNDHLQRVAERLVADALFYVFDPDAEQEEIEKELSEQLFDEDLQAWAKKR